MEHSESIKSEIHYHIRWSESSLDWEPFPTKEEATKLAERIKKRNESYTIVERDRNCERCKVFKSRSKP
jgi:predicted RNA-binding protein with PUA domain